MAWPLSQDYNEAIQNPASSFGDRELRGGLAVTNALGLPMPRSGNFADVYEFTGPSGSKWAIKCFTRQVPGLQERYAEINKHLGQARLPFTVEFQYLPRGIRIAGQCYPVLKMQWVDGFLLNEFVRNNLDKPALLEKLCHIWGRMAERLRESRIAHADLQHGNVILVPGRKAASLALKLIDYDGMWVPALADKKSGELGHPAYQHPRRLRDGLYNAEVDRLPLLAIACALRGLVVGGRSLWDRYDNGDNLLFQEADLRDPAGSALFKELWTIPDPALHDLVGYLILSLGRPLEQVPWLHNVMIESRTRPLSPDEEEQAWAILEPGHTAVRTIGPRPGILQSGPPTAVMPGQAPAAPTSPWDFSGASSPEANRKARVQRSSIRSWALIAGGAAAAVVLSVSLLLMGFLWGDKNNPKNASPIVAAGDKDGTPTAKEEEKAIGDGNKKSDLKNIGPSPKMTFDLEVTPAFLEVEQGRKTKFQVTAVRKGYDGSIMVQLSNLPAEVTVIPATGTIPAGRNTVDLEITAADSAVPGKNNDTTVIGIAPEASNAHVVSSPVIVQVTPSAIDLSKEIVNSIGMKLVLIPAGKFTMGSPPGEKDRLDNEQQREVEIARPFFMGAYEVTQEEYEKIKGRNPSWFSAGGHGKAKVAGLNTRRFPVESVSWDDAVAFCKELSRKESKNYDLPTEAEWEYACRAGTATPFHFGEMLNGHQANHYGDYPYGTDTKGPYLGRTCEVGSYSPNNFGLYDMHGNVWEWCKDWYEADYYQNSPAADPQGPAQGQNRVLRGGSFNGYAKNCRSAYRVDGTPGDRGYSFGFRVVLRVP